VLPSGLLLEPRLVRLSSLVPKLAELSLVPLYANQPRLTEMLVMLRELGFELHAMLPGFTDERTGRSLQMDGVFFRADAVGSVS